MQLTNDLFQKVMVPTLVSYLPSCCFWVGGLKISAVISAFIAFAVYRFSLNEKPMIHFLVLILILLVGVTEKFLLLRVS